MSVYRLYFLEQLSKDIRQYVEFEASSDVDATSKAETHIGRFQIELWCKGRKVWKSAPISKAGARLPGGSHPSAAITG